jgi:mRNA-degrading endonuclease RelE of RelBE toxin-antitoxin system
MNFEIIYSTFFSKQAKKISKKELKLILDKITILKTEPFRFKNLKGYKNTFEIKVDIENSYSRLIYCVYLPKKNQITIFGIFKRKNNFKDFKKFFENYKKI